MVPLRLRRSHALHFLADQAAEEHHTWKEQALADNEDEVKELVKKRKLWEWQIVEREWHSEGGVTFPSDATAEACLCEQAEYSHRWDKLL